MQDTHHSYNPTGDNQKRAIIGTSIYRDGVTYEWNSQNEAAIDLGVAATTVMNHIRNGVDLCGWILKVKDDI